jgi:hypothetical protein
MILSGEPLALNNQTSCEARDKNFNFAHQFESNKAEKRRSSAVVCEICVQRFGFFYSRISNRTPKLR